MSPDSALVLRPGARVARRGAGELQVGLDPPHRVVLPDLPDVRRLLDALSSDAGGAAARSADEPSPSPAVDAARRALLDAGLLVSATALARHRRDLGDVATAVYARHGTDAPARLASRSLAQVHLLVRGDLEVDVLAGLLRTSGIGAVSIDDLPVRRPDDVRPAGDVCVVVSSGRLPRGALDPLVRSGTPHLLLEGGSGHWRLGPFVAPGLTACLRCVDAHQSEPDPPRPLVIEQLAVDPRASVTPDPIGTAWAWATAAHELVSYLDGDQPSTWSSTVELHPAGTVTRLWERHPHCGCAWDLCASA